MKNVKLLLLIKQGKQNTRLGKLILYGSIVNIASAVLNPTVKVHLFDDSAEAVGALGLAFLGANRLAVGFLDLWRTLGVFNVEYGLLGLDKGGKCLALGVLDTLLVD